MGKTIPGKFDRPCGHLGHILQRLSGGGRFIHHNKQLAYSSFGRHLVMRLNRDHFIGPIAVYRFVFLCFNRPFLA